MNIVIHTGGMPFNGNTIPSGASLGGSESAAYYMAKELVAIGHRVVVFTNSQEEGTFDGVQYMFLGKTDQQHPLGDRFQYYMETPQDVCIIQRTPMAFAVMPFNSKVNILWTHDIAMYRSQGWMDKSLIDIDRIFTVSEFHRQQTAKVYGMDDRYILPTFNGIDYELFKDFKDIEREPNTLIYGARPERGLEVLVKEGGIMENLPECKLYVCGYDNTVPQMRDYYNYLHRRCEELPNVLNLGSLGKKDLYRALSKAMIYVYPTEFEDTSCIMALEAQAAGTPVITSHIAALPETLKDSGSLLLKLKDGKVNQMKFIDSVRRVLKDTSEWTHLHNKALGKVQSWAMAAEQWDQTFTDILADKCSNKTRLYKHLERMSDIHAIYKDSSFDVKASHLPDFEDNYGFAFGTEKDIAAHYKAYYKMEKEVKGVNYTSENLFDKMNGGHERFMNVLDVIDKAKPESVLDYGCAHGHYPMNIHKALPKVTITGVDITQSNIDIANKWKEDEKADNVTFVCGQTEAVEGKFDVILIGEVLEHCIDPYKVVEDLMEHLNEGGKMVITVPYGAWEAMGYYKPENIGWRAHIHHFERQDLFEMFGDQHNYQIIALTSGTARMGHSLVTFNPSGNPIGRIDYDRKLKTQNPQETLSVCMIAYNEEDSIGRTLSTVKHIADEIVVAIDERTTDDTERVCLRYGAKVIKIKSPLEIGFDEARNLSIAEASMDWIMWLDADETLENPDNLRRYMRSNCYNGFAIPQHHYAVEPAEKFQTDYPVRIFRNRKGIKFFGFVHEHPEIEINEGVGKIFILPDVHIMHTGYSTEAIRRARFQRNFPLMAKDREKYPDRVLGHFLWLRDLVHYCRYTMEQNGGVMTPKLMPMANDSIKLWRWLCNNGHTRMALDALPFYSEAVNMLHGGDGIDFAINMGVSRMNGGARLEAQPRVGKFACVGDIRLVTDKMIEAKTDKFEEKYF